MSKPIGTRWLALAGAALAMGVLLSWLTYMRSEAVLEVARPLIDRDLVPLCVACYSGARALPIHESGRPALRDKSR